MSGFITTDGSSAPRSEGTKTAGLPRVGGDGGDLEALAATLLDNAEVKECGVLERAIPAGSSDLVAYVVVAEPENFDRIEPNLKELSAGRISRFVPVFYLPVTDQGTIDKTALALSLIHISEPTRPY